MSESQETIEPVSEQGRDGPKSKLLEISNLIVGLHKQFYGRGPTKARSTLARDILVVVLEGGYSRAERTLVESGRRDAVEETRHAMQDVIRERWIEAVEQLLERRVRCFLSASDLVEQIQVETFVLESEEPIQIGTPEVQTVVTNDGRPAA